MTKRYVLMNSLMMPDAGLIYAPRRVSPQEFAEELRNAMLVWNDAIVESYIGYESTARIIADLMGVSQNEIPVNRRETHVNPGDVMLVAKLKYRLGNPKAKGKIEPTLEDFEFYVVDVYSLQDVEFV